MGLKTAGLHIIGPAIYGVGIDFEEAPLPPGHALFHGEKEPPPLRANVVVAVDNCGLYLGQFGVRRGHGAGNGGRNNVLTTFPRSHLARRNKGPIGASIRVDGVAGIASEPQVTS